MTGSVELDAPIEICPTETLGLSPNSGGALVIRRRNERRPDGICRLANGDVCRLGVTAGAGRVVRGAGFSSGGLTDVGGFAAFCSVSGFAAACGFAVFGFAGAGFGSSGLFCSSGSWNPIVVIEAVPGFGSLAHDSKGAIASSEQASRVE